ncbi:MAG: hypothetical protein GY716_23055 [bacterium]|nr:hypothetical protein [bacterium]
MSCSTTSASILRSPSAATASTDVGEECDGGACCAGDCTNLPDADDADDADPNVCRDADGDTCEDGALTGADHMLRVRPWT